MKIYKMKISIITICFNNQKEIRSTIESVIHQSYDEIEYIIVDGGSTDGGMDIIMEYKDKLAKVISEKDENLYDAINKGMKLASGDVVGLIHAGDRLFNSEIIQKIADHFAKNDIDVMYGHSIIQNDKDIPVRVNKSPRYSRGLVRRGWMPSHQSIYIRRQVLDRLGYYNIDLHPSSDYEFFLRYFYFSKLRIKRLDEFVIRFSLGGISTKNYFNNFRAQKDHKGYWDLNGEKAPLFLIPLKVSRKLKQFSTAYWYRIIKKNVNKFYI